MHTRKRALKQVRIYRHTHAHTHTHARTHSHTHTRARARTHTYSPFTLKLHSLYFAKGGQITSCEHQEWIISMFNSRQQNHVRGATFQVIFEEMMGYQIIRPSLSLHILFLLFFFLSLLFVHLLLENWERHDS